MSIRFKLLLSYAAMLVIPLISILVISLLLVIFYQGDVKNLKGVYETTENRFGHEAVEHAVKEIKRTTVRHPDLLLDSTYLNDMSADLEKNDSGIIVRRGDAIYYRSENMAQSPRLAADLPEYARPNSSNGYTEKKEGNTNYVFLQFDVMFRDEPVSLFIISKEDPLTYFIRKYFPTLFVCSLLILIITHVLLTTYMSKNIIRRLQTLRTAAREMKNGNLDFKLQVEGKDEIGQLSMAFEDMRSRMQESIQIQAQYEENRKELIASISHDLRTPLTAIRGYIDGVMEGVADTPEKSARYMKTIDAKAAELEHLINELFLYSKLDLNRQPFLFEAVELLPFLNDLSEELQFELEKKSIAFEPDMDVPAGYFVRMDRDQFKRVLNNIISNSVRYMDKPLPVIRMKAYLEGHQAVMKISDNGIGMKDKDLEHIFERFYRADESRSNKTGGSGLGLAIAKQIMESHNGEITAASKWTAGTTISLSLPIHLREGGGKS
ncbi:two-component sensor histidine kinase [Paenibacillus glycanilyticus]|uniref:histidine kinase n=1 Tax=Paenibacillus glycanilyticus TaxID=126569 RepID=A0ABQ6NFQ9_9BACL|nr:HAMP domain-containing sensor histidine kinase [Paenibacillus glycanilyticus]GMK43946.1 two-component sensor histidine kinase [Paenibacillus glycanilyticus]